VKARTCRSARNAAEVEQTVAELRARGVTAHGAALDVADGAALGAWVQDAATALGGVDIAVADVSALAIGQDEASWLKEFEVDMMGTVRLVNACMPFLRQSQAAAIVAISSVSGREIDFAAGPYGTFKAALIHYIQGLANQLAAAGIRANHRVTGQHLFSGWRLGADQERQSGTLQAGAGPQSDRADGNAQEMANGVVSLASPRPASSPEPAW
jgi:3-oxoacyl-[acyl-carrier protein] reductase